MTREEKQGVIDALKDQFEKADTFYITDSSGLTVEEVNNLRGLCFKSGITLQVAKNTLIQKALEAVDSERYGELMDTLKGPTSLMFTETANAPAKVIREFRKDSEKPILKAAYIDTSIYLGDENVETLANLKSKEELIGEIIGLLQSPAKNVISALQSGGGKLAGLLKALGERGEN